MSGATDIGALLRQAGQRLAAGDARGAEAPLREVLAVAPQTPEALFMLGVVAGTKGDHGGALALFERTLKLRPAFAQAQAQKARCLDALDRRDEAVATAEGVSLATPDPWTLDTAGVVLTRAGLHEKAAAYYARAAAISGAAISGAAISGAAGYHYNHGAALVFLGRFDEAREALRRCLAREPAHGPAWAMLVEVTKQTPDANEIPRLTALAQQVAGEATALHQIGHALAKAYEDLGEPAQAMAWLVRAKAGMRGRIDRAADAALFDAAERTLAASAPAGNAADAPIFVVGLPRTGTTLTERILSSHSAMTSAGELNDLSNALKAATGVRGVRLVNGALVDAAAGVDAAAVGRDYLARARKALGGAGRFVDKMPLNVFLAPFILHALPGARVICLRRHPADAVLSNYRQGFDSGAVDYDYAFDLEETARYVVRFERMVQQFSEVLPPERFMVLSYEALVSDFEAQVRGMLDFCGLPFEEACLRFEENAAPVATPSAAQVREPVNARAVGRWRRYRPALDPALAILIEAGAMGSDELG